MDTDVTVQLARISVRGVVQGVGFRPFVYGLAQQYQLTGWVCNTSEDVKIEVEGQRKALDLFIHDLKYKAPTLASIDKLSISFDVPAGYTIFEIRPSIAHPGQYQLVSPDIATCQPCLEDVLAQGNRRWQYPFTNCTNCGPRFTIIKDIPYDRPSTTMSAFEMCPDCQREYENPLDRRFHAQPNACPICGPQLTLTDGQGTAVKCDDVIQKTGALLRDGAIIAIKGLGGFQLACNAENAASVTLMRRRKRRPSKPFAVMLKDIAEVRKHCTVTAAEEKLLSSPHSPIVLLDWKSGSTICQETAPDLKHLGVMLPYTPLHHLIMRETNLPLIMTSGNISEEPIAGQNEEALRRLEEIADYFLLHNREIYSTYDDSVTVVIEEEPRLLRRARGYAPFPVRLGFNMPQVLGCGAEEKNTFCLTRDDHAFISQHIGDMENMETMEHYERTLELYQRLFRIQPEIIAYDMHTEYLPTKYALERLENAGLKGIPVQHHHAHIASCMADNGISEQVIGLAFDGTGYGTDGKIWGGEFLIADYRGFKRVGQLEYLPLAGGAQAIKRPYRTAISYLAALRGENALDNSIFLSAIGPAEIDIIHQQLRSDINSPLTSSMGRLFDAVSALIGVCGIANYEAQAAIELEMQAYHAAGEAGVYRFSVMNDGGYLTVGVGEILAEIVTDILKAVAIPVISMKFHNTIALVAKYVSIEIRKSTGLNTIALSGGCFQNRLLLSKTLSDLRAEGFTCLMHRQVPCNDGGISLGQAVIAAESAHTIH